MKKNELAPDFGFSAPREYWWLIERGLIGFYPFSALQPWHYLDSESAFSVNQRWPSGPSKTELFAFAKRQDSDDLACFELEGTKVTAVIVIHGWTSNGYDAVAKYQNFWDWLKSVIDDIREWIELPE